MCLELKVKDKVCNFVLPRCCDIQGSLRVKVSQCVNERDGCDWQDSEISLLNSFQISAASQ